MAARRLSARDKAIRDGVARLMGDHHRELLKLRHLCRKMGIALGLFMAATGGRVIDKQDIRKAQNYTRSILK